MLYVLILFENFINIEKLLLIYIVNKALNIINFVVLKTMLMLLKSLL